MSGGGNNVVNKVFYATSYHQIQAGSIDGTDVAPHDNGVRRILLCYKAVYMILLAIQKPPEILIVPYSWVDSHILLKRMLFVRLSKYGKIKSLRLVRHIGDGCLTKIYQAANSS